jgi:hypothetical protein
MTRSNPPAGIEIDDEFGQPGWPSPRPQSRVAARWIAAEGRLYPLIVVDPVGYEAAVTLVCEAADVLRSQCGTVTELVAADAATVLARCPSGALMSSLALDPDTVFDAARAHRWRELTGRRRDAEPGAGRGGQR